MTSCNVTNEPERFDIFISWPFFMRRTIWIKMTWNAFGSKPSAESAARMLGTWPWWSALLAVIGNVGGEIRARAIRFLEDAITLVAVRGRAKPERYLLRVFRQRLPLRALFIGEALVLVTPVERPARLEIGDGGVD